MSRKNPMLVIPSCALAHKACTSGSQAVLSLSFSLSRLLSCKDLVWESVFRTESREHVERWEYFPSRSRRVLISWQFELTSPFSRWQAFFTPTLPDMKLHPLHIKPGFGGKIPPLLLCSYNVLNVYCLIKGSDWSPWLDRSLIWW